MRRHAKARPHSRTLAAVGCSEAALGLAGPGFGAAEEGKAHVTAHFEHIGRFQAQGAGIGFAVLGS